MPVPQSNRITWRRDVLAWCCYDWANSGYTTLMITIFVIFIQRVVFTPETDGATGAIVWAWSVALSMLVGAILSPFVGAVADTRAAKRWGLGLTAFLGGTACIALAIVPIEFVWLAVSIFVFANVCLELSLTFYNGFLPELVDESDLNRVSAAGMGWGYFGGGLALLLAMMLLNYGSVLQLNDEQVLRICIFGTGVWWIVFTIPAILILRDRPREPIRQSLRQTGKTAIVEVIETLRDLRSNRVLLLFLTAFLIYNDGIQTVISQASTFALEEINFESHELVAVVLMIQFVATPGALLVGWLADKFGRRRILLVCLLVWIALLISAWFVTTKFQFWILAAGIALVLGGTQSISRSIMASLTPHGQEARYFGFFNFSGKATSFLGTFAFGGIIALTGSSRLAIAFLALFFVIGLILIGKLKLER